MHDLAGKALIIFLLVWATGRAGDAAPDLDLHDLKGTPHKLADYRGKPVVLNFWATWCVPCASEMPLLSEMQQRYHGRVTFIAASIDEEEMFPAIPPFIKKHKAETLTVMTGATLDTLHDFGVENVMPGTVLIDADGNIVDRISGALKGADFAARLKNLAGEPGPERTPLRETKKNPAKK